jgi:Icc protein
MVQFMTSQSGRIAVFSDMHFMAWQQTLAPVEWVPDLERALQDAARQSPDIFVCNGDLTNGKDRDYDLAMSAIRRHCGRPKHYFTMGNHEYYGFYEDADFSDDLAQQRFLHHTGMPNIHFEVRRFGLSLVFLSTDGYRPDWKDAGVLHPATLHWLEQRLLNAPPGPVLVWFHQPVNDTVADSTNTCMQSDELRSIFSKRPGVLFLSGHTHCRMDRKDQLVYQDGTLFVGGGCAFGDTPQSRWLDIGRNSIVLRIRDHRDEPWLDDWTRTVRFHGGLWSID